MSAASRACHPPMSPSALQKPCTLASNTSSPAKLILHSPQQARKMNGSCCAYIPRCQPLSATCCFPSPTTFNGAWERHGMSQIPKQRVYSKPGRTASIFERKKRKIVGLNYFGKNKKKKTHLQKSISIAEQEQNKTQLYEHIFIYTHVHINTHLH